MGMEFLDTVKEKITTTAKSAAKKSTEIVEITKLKVAVAEEMSAIDKIFRSIGEAIYETYKTGEEADFSFEAKCGALDEAYEKVDDLNARIAELKNTKICPTCKKHMEKDALFCSVCGERFE